MRRVLATRPVDALFLTEHAAVRAVFENNRRERRRMARTCLAWSHSFAAGRAFTIYTSTGDNVLLKQCWQNIEVEARGSRRVAARAGRACRR